VTKICPKCRAENPDTASFCQNCGEDLKKIMNTTKPAKTGNETNINKQSNGSKAAIGLGICCIGIIVIIALVGMVSPDTSTTDSSSDSNSSTYDTSSSGSSSGSSSDSDLRNVQYDPDSGVATATVTCPKCGADAGMASDGEHTLFVCPKCGTQFYS